MNSKILAYAVMDGAWEGKRTGATVIPLGVVE